MATAPTIKPYICRHPSSGAEFSILEFPEGNGQSFKAGELVMVKLSTGKLIVATDAALVSLANADQGKLVGVALSDASGTEDTKIPVECFDAHTQVLMNVKEAASADHVLAATDIGKAMAIQVASNVWTLNSADVVDGSFVVVQVHPRYAVGDTNAWVYAQPLTSRLLLTGGTAATS